MFVVYLFISLFSDTITYSNIDQFHHRLSIL